MLLVCGEFPYVTYGTLRICGSRCRQDMNGIPCTRVRSNSIVDSFAWRTVSLIILWHELKKRGRGFSLHEVPFLEWFYWQKYFYFVLLHSSHGYLHRSSNFSLFFFVSRPHLNKRGETEVQKNIKSKQGLSKIHWWCTRQILTSFRGVSRLGTRCWLTTEQKTADCRSAGHIKFLVFLFCA